jgi:hypothetical protein
MDPRITDDRIPLVRNDTGPQIRLVLTDTSTGQPINLSGATATLYFRAVGTTQLLLTRPLFIPGPTAVDGVAFIVWETDDLDHPAGNYEGEVEVLLQSGIRQTVYDPLRFKMREDF